ncbi:MAG: TerB family tellurite resistance protein [Rubrivivax sp.]|nr:TerB family tellurite resistance protein [Rubrivivax sp.]
MLQTRKDLLDHLRPAGPAAPPHAAAHVLQLATAVMLVEVMRADTSLHDDEHVAVLLGLREKFHLGADEAQRLSDLAVTTARQATDLFSFTQHLDSQFDMAQKLRMIELMWGVAYADGVLSAHERHVLWRVADLLHVPQGAYVLARMPAEQAARGG